MPKSFNQLEKSPVSPLQIVFFTIPALSPRITSFLSCIVISRHKLLKHMWAHIIASTILSVGVISGIAWWKVPLLNLGRQHSHWSVWSQSSRVMSCRACNANAMTGEPSSPSKATRCMAAVGQFVARFLCTITDLYSSLREQNVWSWWRFTVYFSFPFSASCFLTTVC